MSDMGCDREDCLARGKPLKASDARLGLMNAGEKNQEMEKKG